MIAFRVVSQVALTCAPSCTRSYGWTKSLDPGVHSKLSRKSPAGLRTGTYGVLGGWTARSGLSRAVDYKAKAFRASCTHARTRHALSLDSAPHALPLVRRVCGGGGALHKGRVADEFTGKLCVEPPEPRARGGVGPARTRRARVAPPVAARPAPHPGPRPGRASPSTSQARTAPCFPIRGSPTW
eukprot:scaffold1449_cov324-Prasinococcus_capsulatus_cf.AAC.18